MNQDGVPPFCLAELAPSLFTGYNAFDEIMHY